MVAVFMAFSRLAETESQCIARALRRKDSEFIGRLVSRYHYRLLRYLVYLTSRREQAEDLIQETWLCVLERAGQYDSRLPFEPWLFSIARNLAIDDLRRRQRASRNTSDVPVSETVLDLQPSDLHSPFLAAAKSEDAVRIAVALGGLKPIYREALLLRFQEELSLEEIARVTGAPVSTISSRIQRGLLALRSSLEGGANAE
jgi:RNA polymerase sigma-70 factor (ECF subfamily)